MASGDPELRGGFSIAQWVKAKPTDAKRELEPFAASPPPHDDSFFYIRYPKPEGLFQVSKPTAEPKILVQDTVDIKPKTSAALTHREVDWTKHTKSCQEVLHEFAAPAAAPVNVLKAKPVGTDDGFRGEGAACGSSVLKVAHKMVSSRTVSQRGFTVATPADDDVATPPPPAYYATGRRGSRSLPASPLHSPPGSPNSRRKRNANRYFTSPFEPSDALSSRSWLTAALLGYKKDAHSSTHTLHEEDLHTRLQESSLMASVESLGPAPRVERDGAMPRQPVLAPTQEPALTKPAASFRPKPTEFREMNFWSPTSM